MDLHLHTPASIDFQEPSITFLDILKKAEAREPRSHRVYRSQQRGRLRALPARDRAARSGWKNSSAFCRTRSASWKSIERLRKKILVLPGFEFTATFGFHILGIFPETTPVRVIEHVLLNLNVPADKLDQGATECGATADVLTAYRLIDEAGGLAIAAHVNSSHGVAMRGLDFGGQTKIAYTQDAHLHALEVTDLDSKSKRSTATFFNGTKPEYPRRMHCIQSFGLAPPESRSQEFQEPGRVRSGDGSDAAASQFCGVEAGLSQQRLYADAALSRQGRASRTMWSKPRAKWAPTSCSRSTKGTASAAANCARS